MKLIYNMTIKTNREFILNKEWTLLKNAFNKKNLY